MNLIVTCSRHLEEEASDEISKTLVTLGDAESKTEHSRFSGIVVVDTSLDPFQVVDKIRTKILDEPWSIRYCHRFIPIQESMRTTLENIVAAVQKHAGRMQSGDSYRITVEKRGSELSTKELIDSIAGIVKNKVSLEEYDWNITVEILGDITGISILKDPDIVSTLKTKRDSME
ncbi:MAG: THUMP domain-containing protein [Thaumarchaeota archaeon]|nr:THUMP domain-containing protein [Nitrososphaerota archaeon]